MGRFGSDVQIELTSMQEEGESLMGQDRVCRPGDSISPIQGDECVLWCPFLCRVFHYRLRTELLNSRVLVGPYSSIRLSPSSCIEVSSIWTSLPNLPIKLALRL
ncbi:hypothetical protein AVEN_237245-1 [Araneus ventricosus]|uniref:Uncharacterized protein n=1 Tax=Araneus ventricosus TaxID=182803 RepID=A0A4Y2Q564_ARAVE|nr:hypothetical protein AVEN_237245-1 [Araneus ventricosus]